MEEGIELREAGIDAPILLLSEPPPAAAPVVVGRRLTPFVYTAGGIDALGAAAAAAGTTLPVHLKVDTGMHRVGCTPAEAVALAERIHAHPGLVLEGLATHLAVADEADRAFTDAQLDAFDAVLDAVTAAVGRPPIVHSANSAGALAFPRARYDLVRVGITLYGIDPSPVVAGHVALRPALSLHARVSFVKNLPAGARVSYGLRYELPRPLAHRDRARRVRRRCAPGARGDGGSGARGWATVPDRRNGDDGPAAGRRRRPGRRGGRRRRVPRRPGRPGDRRRRVGAAPRHHPLRGGHSPRAAACPATTREAAP